MAKKKGPPPPRKKSPEELKEEAFRAKCEEAARAKAASASSSTASMAPPAAGGIKIMNRPASLTDLTRAQAPGEMKKSTSGVDLVASGKPQLSEKQAELLMNQVKTATDIGQLLPAFSAKDDEVRRAAGAAAKAMASSWSKEEQAAKMEKLWEMAMSPASDKETERLGSAFGYAALVSMGGPGALNSMNLWARLESASKDKKQQNAREAAANIIGGIGLMMGRGFEVHLTRSMPLLLSLQGDGAPSVRDCAIVAAITCLQNSSYHGASRILPQIVSTLNESKWTCKTGALQILMAMCEFAAQTVYTQFPLVMPALRDALAETHPKVKMVAELALKTLCGIVQYPEVISMIDSVEETLIDPVSKMADCLDVMMDITFVNAVDAPPLELVVPILSRALKDRRADLRKKAAKCCGNMCTLVLHPKVLVPHVSSLLPGIQAGLVESQPEVREVCARALTGMVQGMGGPPVYKLLPELEKLQTTMTDAPAADARDQAHKDVEALAVNEIQKCSDAVKAEADQQEAELKQTASKLHDIIKNNLPTGTLPEAEEHANEVAEVVLFEAVNRADGKGAQYAEVSMSEAFRFLEECVSKDIIKKICDEACQVVRAVAEEDGGAAPSGDERIVDLRNIILAYPGRVLLQRSHLYMDRGHCYGLVGQNGVGKTTIMTRIAQQDIHNFPTHLKCVYVQHEVHRGVNDGESVLSFMRSQVPGETDDDMSEALRSVGFSEKMIHGPVVDLSGGWRMKLAIARAMLQRADILLLDEPTNHLDAASVAWLAGYIQSLKGTTVMIVSHDADFMEKVVTDVIHIHDLKLTYYSDGFGNFRRKNQWLFPEDGEELGEAPASPDAQEAQSPAEDADGASNVDTGEVEVEGSAASVPGEKPYGTYDFTSQPFNFPDPGKLEGIKSKRKPVLTMTGVSFRYPGAEKDTLHDINVKLCLASRVALVGPNGAGKTTLLRLLVGDLPTNSGVGEVWKHHNLRLSYVAQHSMHHLEANLQSSPIAYIQERFGFGKDKEVENKVTIKLTPDEKDLMAQRGEISEVLSRRKLGKTIEYEVLRTGRKVEDSQWFSMNDLKLQKPYVMKLVKAYDEKLAASASGADQRPITIPEIKKHLKDFGINEVLATGKIKNLSGGQKSRLVMAAALWSKPHLLALDEPTNYIDRETLAALAESLKTFNGGVFIISHNAAFVEEVCNEQWPVSGGTCHAPQKLGKDKDKKGSKADDE